MEMSISTTDNAQTNSEGSLLRHDLKIASAAFRAILRKPIDLMTVVVAAPIFALVSRSWNVGLSDQVVKLQSTALAVFVAFYSVSFLMNRCAYHRTDGALAAFAQRNIDCLRYALPIFGACVASGFLVSVILSIWHPAIWLAGTIAGSLAGAVWSVISQNLRQQITIFLNRTAILHRSNSKAASVLVASGALLGVVTAILPVTLQILVFGALFITLIAAIILGRVDAEAIRFQTMIGHSSLSLIWSHTSRLLAFSVPFAVALILAPHWAPAVVSALLTVAAAAFVVLRVLAYQSFSRRIADWVVTLSLAAAALVGLAFPPITPALLLAAAVWLWRRAIRQIWLVE